MAETNFPTGQFLMHRAEQCRAIARMLRHPADRSRMIDLALGYEEIAKSAARINVIKT